MSVHAFVDESTRNGCYLLCVTVVDPAQLTPTRMELARLLLPGAREVHFKKEKPPRRRHLADRIAGLSVSAHDKATLQRRLGSRPSKTELTYEHLPSTAEPLLWIFDTVAWCHGAGGDWRRRVEPVVAQVVEV